MKLICLLFVFFVSCVGMPHDSTRFSYCGHTYERETLTKDGNRVVYVTHTSDCSRNTKNNGRFYKGRRRNGWF